MASKERDAWALLIQCGVLERDELYSPGKAAEGDYTARLKVYRQQQAATEDGDLLAASDPSRPKTTEAKLLDLARVAEAQLDRPWTRRLIHLRHAAAELGLNLRDSELQGLLNDAQRRRDGLAPSVGRAALDLAPVPWLVVGLLLAGALNLLVAPPKLGKNSLVLSLIGRWARGARQFLGLDLVGPCPPVLLLGPDQPEVDWGRMLQAEGLLDHGGRLAEPLVDLATAGHDWQLDGAGIDFAADHARRHPGLLVIIDSYRAATRLSGIDENTAQADQPIRALMAALDGTEATVVLIHHGGKTSRSSPTLASRGSSAIPAAASQVIGLERVAAEEGARDRRVVLKTEGRGGQPLELLVERSPDWGWIAHGDAAQVAIERRLQAAEDKLTDRQADALDRVRSRGSEGLVTSAEDLLDLIDGRDGVRAARRTLDQLAQKGLINAEMVSGPGGRRKTYRPRREEVRTPCTPPPVDASLASAASSPSETRTVLKAETLVGERERTQRTVKTHRTGVGGGEDTHVLPCPAAGLDLFASASLGLPPVGSGADAHLDADDPAWGPSPAA